MKTDQTTFLVIEDDANDAVFLRRAFNAAGVASGIQTVTSAEEAITYLCGEGKFTDRSIFPFPDVILTDLKMPMMSGIDFLKWLSSRPDGARVPAVVLTSTGEGDAKAAFDHGAHAYMLKPVSYEDLEKVVRVIVDYWQLVVLRPGFLQSNPK